jgi:hypothetical protein
MNKYTFKTIITKTQEIKANTLKEAQEILKGPSWPVREGNLLCELSDGTWSEIKLINQNSKIKQTLKSKVINMFK